jgi:ribonuclease HI
VSHQDNNANDSAIETIVAAIQRLSPAQRRQLQRHLRVSGLLVPDSTLTDQDRLNVAPALGLTPSAPNSTPTPQPRARASTSGGDSRGAVSLQRAEPNRPTGATSYRSPVSGKVVVGGAASPAAKEDPHAMSPLPGQAPEQSIGIVFDGGSRGNPGQGYGSYELRWPGSQPQIVRLNFGNQVTNNEAEYDTLIAALEGILKRLRDQGADPATARVDVRGDSLLVVNQVLGKWQVKEARMQARVERARQLLKQFGQWQLRHHDRSHSVEALGH